MELAIPIIALGGMYIASIRSNKKSEPFSAQLPNTNIPDTNWAGPPSMDSPEDATSSLSATHAYGPSVAYTDKYFYPQSPPKDNGAVYTALSGQSVGSDYFTHNNTVPFFGSKTREIGGYSEATLDNYSGAGSQHTSKREQEPMFSPSENMQWSHGMPTNTDFIQSRINQSMSMAGVKPFESIQVGPGMGAGYSAEGQGGFNSGMMARDQWREKGVDELRVANKQKASGTQLLGFEGPAIRTVKNMGQMGVMEKNRVDTTFEMGQDRLMTTVGIQKNPELRGTPIQRYVNRPETTTSYTGGGGYANPAHYVKGEYMESTNIQHGPLPLTAAYAGGHGGVRDGDYGAKSGTVYNNSRMANADNEEPYFGAIASTFRAAMAPILDVLRPSRRENVVGNLRPYENAKSRVANSYIFDPTDRPAPTIRETTEDTTGHMYINSGQRGGAYKVVGVQAAPNQRDTTSNYSYVGNGDRGSQPRTYDAEYNQRNNDIKASTIEGYMVSGNMALMNGNMNMTSRAQNSNVQSARAVTSNREMGMIPSIEGMGRVRNTQGLYGGAQADRNNGDIMEQLKGNPYTQNILNSI